MEPGRRFDALDADEHTNIESRATSDQNDSPSIRCNVDPNMGYENKPGEILKNLQNVSYMYRQDVVRSKTRTRIGIVTEVAGDSDSDSSITDDEDEDEEEADDEAGSNEEGDLENDENSGENVAESNEISDDSKNNPLTADQVRVLWMDGSEMTESTNDVEVIDRGFLHGDYVASASDPTGQIGIVVNVHINVDLLTHDGSITRDIPSRDLKRIRDFTVGDHVVLGPWLGRIEDVFDNVTVQLDDGSVCRVMKADPLHLKPLGKNVIEDGHFPYYPGQRVKATSSSVFKNSRWLSGLWKANRLEGTVTKVTVGSVFIYWIASAGYGPDSATTPAEEQNPKNLSLLSCFAHTNWQLGDWCLLPSSEESSVTTLNRGSLKADSHDSAKDEPESTGTGDNSDAEVEQSSRDDRSIENNVDASLSNDFETSENKAFAEDLSSSSLPASKEVPHETWPLHRKKIRRVVVRKDKKARKKVDNFERALLIINTSTKVDVVWQDGSIKRDLDSTSLIPIDSPGDHEFVAEQYVVEKAADSDDAVETRRVGVIKSVNAKDRTACVRWLKPVARAEDPREFDKDEMVSVYELEGHPDYDYCYGDVVVRLSPISLPDKLDTFVHSVENMPLGNPHQLKQENEKNHEGEHTEKPAHDISAEFSDLSWVGNITGLRDGDIEVTWADGMISTVGPQAIYVVGRDDDESIAAGSDGFDDAASWETVEDEIDNGNQPEDHEAEDVDSGLEIEDDTVASENSGKNGALSIPLAAIGFMTELASGIISRVRRHSDPLDLDVKKDDDLQPEGLTLNSDRDSGSSSRKHYNIEDAAEASDLLEIAETLCNLQPPESNAPRGEFISTFRGFDIVRDPLDHHFLGAHKQNNAARKWLKKVQQDWDILQNNLPEGIYVRAYEDRMDLLRAVIVGAYGTPYQDGLFFFDFHLPQEYPDVPPSAYYHSGGWRINPNLYEEGKVCLSLLNTWTGRGNEVWDPSTSSILQVLVSLQGLVLNSKPYFNEAGYDKQVGTAEGEKNSLSYNENTFLLNCKTMMSQMRRPPKDFEELVSEHFKKRGRFILKACDAYMKGHLIGSLVEDASARDSNDNSNSVGFKLMLAKVLPKLLSALNEVGADCLEFEHLKLTKL